MLDEYRVLDLTDERGHLAGSILAAMGADVIAVEPPTGSGARRRGPFAQGEGPTHERSLNHWAHNRGKRSVVADHTTAEGQEVIRRLAATADLLIESHDPGVLDAAGLGYEDLAAINPGLVYTSITPFGSDGPKRDWAATDLTLMAAGGYLSLTGDHDRAPLRVGVPQAWYHAAGDAAGASLIALWERHESGLGQHVDISAQQSVLQATQSMVLATPFNAPLTTRVAGGAMFGPHKIELVWPAKDGHVSIAFLFGTSIGPFTARLMAWACEEGFLDEATRDIDWVMYGMALFTGERSGEHYESVKRQVAAFTSSKTKAELLEEALRRRLLIAPVADVDDVLGLEQFAVREFWEEVDGVRYPGPFARMGASPLRVLGRAPKLGEHTEEVLAEPIRAVRPAAVAATTPAAETRDTGPLAGLKVLDFMWAMAGPAASRVLADYGATVVRVESMTKLEVARGLQPFVDDIPGAENSGLFANMNTGKLGITLDLNKEGAREIVLDLVRWADVLCESFTPRAMKAWGLDYETLRQVNPRLIMVSTCLMGQTGPLNNFAGFGNLAAAICGFTGIVGWPDRSPAGPFSAYTDYISPRFTVAAIFGALEQRRRTGEGQYVDFSQAEASMHCLAPALLDRVVNGNVAGRIGNTDPQMAPHGVYPAAGEDRWVAIACANDAQWAALAGALGRGDLAGLTTEERLARREELDGLVAAWTAPQDEAAVEERLIGLGVPAHRVQNSPELLVDPQLAHREHFVTLPHATHGTLVVEGSRMRLSRTPARYERGAPTLGEHTFEVLSEHLGYDVDRIADLAAAELLD